MKCLMLLACSALVLTSTVAAEKETRCFELRTYYAAPGKLEALQSRFRDHTRAIFASHGMVNIGYWLPLTNTENKLVYLLAFPSREAREKAWREFGADPKWKAVVAASEKDGKLVTKVEAVLLAATDFSPPVAPEPSNPARVYELRTYHAAPGKLGDLLARFANHTTALFAKHGMTQFGYFVPTEAKDGAGETLIYLLVHKSPEACAESFKAFRADPEWIKAKADSEVNGSLTVQDGVKSLLMAPTDFSPAK